VAFENALKVLIEIALQPLSNSRFIEKAEDAAAKLGMHNLFEEYEEKTGLGTVDSTQAKDRLRLFKSVWDEVYAVANKNPQTLECAHFKVRKRLGYYLNPGFIQGVVKRASAMTEAEKTVEVAHYLDDIVLDLVENYAWLKSLIQRVKIDYTTLISTLEGLEGRDSANYRNITTLLDLNDIDKTVAAKENKATRDAMLRIRRSRKLLINNAR